MFVAESPFEQEMFVKHYAALGFLVQNKLHKCMKKKFISGNCSLKNLEWFWNIWPQNQ